MDIACEKSTFEKERDLRPLLRVADHLSDPEPAYLELSDPERRCPPWRSKRTQSGEAPTSPGDPWRTLVITVPIDCSGHSGSFATMMLQVPPAHGNCFQVGSFQPSMARSVLNPSICMAEKPVRSSVRVEVLGATVLRQIASLRVTIAYGR